MGMFESQANEVMEIAIPRMNVVTDGYKIDFNDCSSTYPEAIYNVLFISVKAVAREWIAENKPQAWFRPMFENN